jgi:hypothetical protein
MFGGIEVKDQDARRIVITTVFFGLFYEKVETEYYESRKPECFRRAKRRLIK